MSEKGRKGSVRIPGPRNRELSVKVGIVIILAFILSSTPFPFSSTRGAIAATSGDFEYRLIDNGTDIEITGYHGYMGNVEIPSIIEGRPVTSIGNEAFSTLNNSIFIMTVKIPDTVIKIDDGAFSGCGSLTNVSIPSSVTYIGDDCFSWCGSLTIVFVPINVSYIGEGAFANDASLTSINVYDGNRNFASLDGVLYSRDMRTLLQFPGGGAETLNIPSNVTSINRRAFAGCASLGAISVDVGNTAYASLDGVLYSKDLMNLCKFPPARNGTFRIPNSVTSIGDAAFQNSALASVTMTEGVTRIGNDSFYQCYSLTSINIPDSVKVIGDRAFFATSLTSVDIPEGVTVIGNSTFQGCRLAYVNIPGSVTTVEFAAFCNCDSLTHVILTNGVTCLGDFAFCMCTSLKELTIPNSITTIGNSTFGACSSLAHIAIPNNVTYIGESPLGACNALVGIDVNPGNPSYSSVDGVLYDEAGMTLIQFPAGKGGSFTIPNSVTSIGKGAFYGCGSLTSVIIPGSVRSIGEYALSSCASMTQLHFEGNAPACGQDWILSQNESLEVYFFNGSSGFTTPTWYGIKTVEMPVKTATHNLEGTAILVAAVVLLLMAYLFLRKPKAKK